MNKQRKVLITITYNEMGIIIDTKAEEVAQPNLQPTCNQLATDCISRQAAIDAAVELAEARRRWETSEGQAQISGIDALMCAIEDLPSARHDLTEEYGKAVFTWLTYYQIKMAELNGRYTPYEVLSWVINDWRKEHG